MRRGARFCAVGLVTLVAAACGPARSAVVVERMDVALTVLVDGSVQVDEHITARFGDQPVTTFHRHTPVWRHDGVFDVVATMDGRPFTAGSGTGYLQAGKGPDLDATWTFAPVSNGAHHFGLSYRAANAVALSGIRGTVSWLTLPARRDFDVSDARVTLTLPAGAVLLQDPWVEEPGWLVARLPNGMTASRTNLTRREAATVGLEFTVDRMAASTPQWQFDQSLADEFIPAFISAALFVLVVAGGVVRMVWFKFPTWRLTPGDSAGVDVSGITPAMRLAIERGRVRGDRTELVAAIDGLVSAGALDDSGAHLTVIDVVRARTSHEQVVAGEVWLHKPDGVARAVLLSRRVRRGVGRALEADLVTAGLADPDRVRAGRDLRRAGGAVTVFGLATWAAVAMAMRQFGAWPLAVPGSIVITGIVFLLAAARLPVTSRKGAAARVLYFARASDGRTSA